jgi:hypothetical protein
LARRYADASDALHCLTRISRRRGFDPDRRRDGQLTKYARIAAFLKCPAFPFNEMKNSHIRPCVRVELPL